MKLMVFGDTHGNDALTKKILEKAKKEKVDALICDGDFTVFGSRIRTLLEKINSAKIPTFIVPGNHESDEELEVYSRGLEYIKNVHMKSLKFKDMHIMGCGGGGFTPEHAEFEMSEKDFASSMKKLSSLYKGLKTILVTHQPPYKTATDKIFGHYVGSTSIRKFIEKNQPDFCITGHIHETEGKSDKIGKTFILNPGRKGKIIEL